MFVEHLVLKHEGMLPYARRMNSVSTWTINSLQLFGSQKQTPLLGIRDDIAILTSSLL